MRNVERLVASLVGVGLLALGLAGCSAPPAASGSPPSGASSASGSPPSGAIGATAAAPKPAASSGGSQAAAPAAQAVKLRLSATDLDNIFSRAQIRLALDRGWYREVGIDVELISGAGGGDTMRVVTAGSADMAIGGAPAGILAALQDDTVKLIAPYNNEDPFLVVTRPDSQITKIADLSGRKLGFSRPGSASQGILNLVLERAGITGVQMVATGPLGDTWTAVRGGVVDAGWSQDPSAAGMVQKGEARVVVRAAEYVPDYFSDFILARQDFLRQQPETTRAFLQATDRAGRYIVENWTDLVPTLAGYYQQDETVVRTTLQSMNQPRVWSIRVYPEAFSLVEQTMRDSGQIKEPVPWNRIFDQQYLPETERAKL